MLIICNSIKLPINIFDYTHFSTPILLTDSAIKTSLKTIKPVNIIDAYIEPK